MNSGFWSCILQKNFLYCFRYNVVICCYDVVQTTERGSIFFTEDLN